MTEAEFKKQLQSTNPLEIEQALLRGSNSGEIQHIIDLFESIWKMTYAASSDPEFKVVQNGSLADKIVLMNEQEDLIPAGLPKIEEVTELDLGGFPESAFFPELLRYKKLQKLQFWENEVNVLPDAFFELEYVSELYLSCDLEEISPLIEKLQQLKILMVSGNKIKYIPASIQKLNKLEELDLSNNQLSELPAFLAELPNLKTLHIYGNPDLVVKNPGIYEEKGIELVD